MAVACHVVDVVLAGKDEDFLPLLPHSLELLRRLCVDVSTQAASGHYLSKQGAALRRQCCSLTHMCSKDALAP